MASKVDKDLQILTPQEGLANKEEEVKSKEETTQPLTEGVRLKECSLNSDTNYVREALTRFLPNHTVDTFELPEANSLGDPVVMQVLRIGTVRITPDPFGVYLAYGTPQTRYTLYRATNNANPFEKKYLYQWETRRRTLVTSPFHEPIPTQGSRVPCATSDITDALMDKHPIEAIVKVLGTIKSNRMAINNGLDGPDFSWRQSGPDFNFTVSVPDYKSLWEDINESRLGAQPKPGIRLTGYENNKLRLKLVDV
ncbi:hypothetical protein LOD99_9283 [Oopsacas minuta]|uniref:Uncharacterized protein n=1 Tax=Oopsacas minuta TaxID=111878 RepID=A0AAV7JC67_9METZ|nr:hypothetical protein LOD99_9283 [Oopsacas minuta]